MMIREFLERLNAADIKVWLQGDALRCSAPKGSMTPALEAELKRRKAEILAFLRAGVAVNSSVVPIQPKGSRLPFFGIPGHNGDIFCYVPLAQCLGDDQPLFGLQPPGFNRECAPLSTMSDLAGHYARQLTAFFPAGPYLLGGYCAGGAVAFEVAQLLMVQGAQVTFFALFGSPFPDAYAPWHRFTATCRYFADRIPHHVRRLLRPGAVTRTRYIQDRIQGIREALEGQHNGPTDDGVRIQIEQATMTAVRAYSPSIFPGRIHLFMPSQGLLRQDYGRSRTWARHAQAGLQVYVGPDECTGATMLREPFVKVFADHLRAAIDKELLEHSVESHCRS